VHLRDTSIENNYQRISHNFQPNCERRVQRTWERVQLSWERRLPAGFEPQPNTSKLQTLPVSNLVPKLAPANSNRCIIFSALALTMLFQTLPIPAFAAESSTSDPSFFKPDSPWSTTLPSHKHKNKDKGKLPQQDFSVSWKAELAEGERFLLTKEYSKAEYCFRQACNHVQRLKPAPPDDVVVCLESLAKVLYMEDEIVETIPLYKKALKILQKAYGKDSVRTVPTLVAIANIFEDEGDYKKATEFYQPAIDIVSRTKSGANQLLLADYQHRLGRVQFKQGLNADAESSYLKALTLVLQPTMQPTSAFIEDVLADYTTLLLSTIYNAKTLRSAFQNELLKDQIGSLKRKSGAPISAFSTDVSIRMADKATADAIAAEEKSIRPSASDITKAGITPTDYDTASIKTDRKYSDFAALEDINKQRVSFYERMIAADIDSLGAQHPSVARDLNGLASVYLSQRNYNEAKPLLARALEIYEKAYISDSGPAKQTRLLLQLINEEQNPNVAPLDLTYVESLPKIPAAAQKLEVALRLNDLAFMLYRQNKMATALTVYTWALASTAASTGESSILSASSMIDVSRLLRSTGRAADAERFESNARAIARQDLLDKRSRLTP
jgi:tetratricopeptide (TPR) repeat protein